MIRISSGRSGRSVELFDPVRNASVTLQFQEQVSWHELETSAVPTSVDRAWAISGARFSIDRVPAVILRDEEGAILHTIYSQQTTTSRPGRSILELGTPVKVYVVAESFVDVRAGQRRVHIDVSPDETIILGAQTTFDQPKQTVVTTERIEDVFAAISTFGQLPHTRGPDRSFQIQRHHPPEITFGSSVSIPKALQPRDRDDLRLELPATYMHAAMAAPVAYYLDATVTPGGPPALQYQEECLLTWSDDKAVEEGCARLLQRMVFLDCLARDVAEYEITLDAQAVIGDYLDDSWEHLRSCSPGERLRAYLEVPWSVIESELPPWNGRAASLPNRTTIEALPYIAYDLSPVVRATPSTPHHRLPVLESPRDGSFGIDGIADETTLSLGNRQPIGTDGTVLAALRHRSRRNTESEHVSVTVVCNDARMLPEQTSAGTSYIDLPASSVEVHDHRELSVEELGGVLKRPTDYLHYIGHIRGQGFECADGSLRTDELAEVGAEVFFLNSCQSWQEGAAMIARGAIGGIATRGPVANSSATIVGQTIAELLIRGFPLGVALLLAQEQHPGGSEYVVMGDPRVSIAGSESGLPYLCEVERVEDTFDVRIRSVLTSDVRKGSLASFHLGDDERFYLNPAVCAYQVDRAALDDFLAIERVPTRWQDEWHWSDDVADEINRSSTDRP